MKTPKIALATEFLTQYGGAQKTLEAIAQIYPDAPIYTAKYEPKNMSAYINSRKIICPKAGFINKASKYFFTFLMAPIFEQMDFREFDIIISDGTTWTKGIITKPEQLHISYVHTPPRFLYGYSTESTKRDKWYFKLPFSYIDNIFRLWDFTAAQRPEFLIANSNEIRKRILKFYRRDATVIYPPVEIEERPTVEPSTAVTKPYYLAWGRLAAYKKFDQLIEAFNILGWNLVLAGTGSSESALKKLAGPTITMTGKVSEPEKHALIDGCVGVINSIADEDFGIVPIEAQSHGKPVLAHKSGGHLETVSDGFSGMLYPESTVDCLVEYLKKFDAEIKAGKFNSEAIKASVQKFNKERFMNEMRAFVDEKWADFGNKKN